MLRQCWQHRNDTSVMPVSRHWHETKTTPTSKEYISFNLDKMDNFFKFWPKFWKIIIFGQNLKNHHFCQNDKSSIFAKFWKIVFLAKIWKNINFCCKLKNHHYWQKFEKSSFLVKFEKVSVSFQCCQHYNTETTLVSLVL